MAKSSTVEPVHNGHLGDEKVTIDQLAAVEGLF